MDAKYDIIVIGAGSGGLGVSLFAAKVGLKTLLVDRSDKHIGGDCLNDGCIPSKALIHISKIMSDARKAEQFGTQVSGKPKMALVNAYIAARQRIIRNHENTAYLKQQGIDVVLGQASFYSPAAILVNEKVYVGKKIIIATGSRPASLVVPGIEFVKQYNNESIFDLDDLPGKLLVIGGGPVGIEISQALSRLGSKVTVVQRNKSILPHDDVDTSRILLSRLQAEGITFKLDAEIEKFQSSNEAIIRTSNDFRHNIPFDAIFVATGRVIDVNELALENAGIKVKDGNIIVDKYLRTTNKNVLLCGDVAGSLKFSHAAEQHARILINNLFSPMKRKLTNKYMSWVTFTDPEVATFGLSERALSDSKVKYQKLTYDFKGDDRAVVDDYQYGKLILFLSKGGLFGKQKILGGSMVSPVAGELIQELILAMREGLSIKTLFNKIYPYPVASRVNQLAIVSHKEKQITPMVTKLMRFLFRSMN
ncbi:MAG TPA: FAD-dependent oxidoreductase [Ohtaekwangia sp.]|nr:FAD-dependent oxidoreductase [Ohtaekwangia sp.]